MVNKVNNEILDFINEGDYDDSMKDFLNKILVLELDLMEEAKRKKKKNYDYADKYKSIINKMDI